jgi:hypothetical protein
MNIIETIGGNGFHKKVIGGNVNYKINDFLDKWKIHKKIGDSKFTIKTVNEILCLTQYINDEELLKQVMVEIWNAPINKIFHGIVKSLKLDNPIELIYKNLFWKLKELIESIILIHLKEVQNKNISDLLVMWKDYILKNKIDTSSAILWTLFDKNSPEYNKYFSNIEYNYLGYCPYVPNKRLIALLNFPVDILIKDIKSIDISEELLSIEKKINDIINISYTPKNINKCIKVIIKDDFKTTREYIINFINIWLKYIKCLKPYLEDYEKHIIKEAKKIDKFSKSLSKVNSKLLTFL